MSVLRYLLKGLDWFVRGVGIVGIWCFVASWHVLLWTGEIAIKFAWTLFMGFIEFWLGLLALIFVIRHHKRE